MFSYIVYNLGIVIILKNKCYFQDSKDKALMTLNGFSMSTSFPTIVYKQFGGHVP